jgi:dUTP pyrophosphatase
MQVKYLFDNLSQKFLLKPETKGSSGIDLRSNYVYKIDPGKVVLVKTGLHVQIPEGYEIQIRSRSGLALKKGIMVLNSPGTVDCDYRNEVGVILFNTSNEPFIINVGDRIAQMVVCRTYTQETEFVEVKELDETERKGGFGSTGKN